MEVILANPRGFCAGVNMAIDSLNRALELFGAPVYVFHEIVHNQHVVREFETKGARFVHSVSDVPEGSVLLFSAHGVSPLIREQSAQSRLVAIDATCPLVTKVHVEARKFAQAGYTVLYIGHEGHDEVVGTLGEAPDSMVLIQSREDVEKLEFPENTPLACLTQTTLSVDETREILAAVLEKFPQTVQPRKEDICYATQNRQDAVKRAVDRADLVLVIGSQNSSNSKRLAELARQRGVCSHLIEDVRSLRLEWLEGKKTVLVTAGASAPEWIVRECVAFLKSHAQTEVTELSGPEENVLFGLPKALQTP